MPLFDKTVPKDEGVMRFPQPRLDWRAALSGLAVSPDTAHLFILDENENFMDERRQCLAVAAELGFAIRCGQNRVQTRPLDRQFYIVRLS